MTSQENATKRFFKIGVAALLLLSVAGAPGLYLNNHTRSPFREVKAGWTGYGG
jgi:hypothetical protein